MVVSSRTLVRKIMASLRNSVLGNSVHNYTVNLGDIHLRWYEVANDAKHYHQDRTTVASVCNYSIMVRVP